MTYMLINKMTTKPGRRQDVTDLLLESGRAFADNEACIMFLVSHDTVHEDIIWVQDVWTGQDEHAAAMADSEMQRYVKQAMPLLAGTPEQSQINPIGGKF